MENGLGVDRFLLGFVRLHGARVTGMRSGETFSGWRMTILSSIIQNLAIGTTYGGFGVSVLAIQSEFGTNRAVASSALSFVLAAVTLGAPILGTLYSRVSIRRTIMLGSLLAACGYALLTIVQGQAATLACYGLLIGPGVALTGTMPCNVLVMNWFVAKPGKALGIVNLPAFVTIFPICRATEPRHLCGAVLGLSQTSELRRTLSGSRERRNGDQLLVLDAITVNPSEGLGRLYARDTDPGNTSRVLRDMVHDPMVSGGSHVKLGSAGGSP